MGLPRRGVVLICLVMAAGCAPDPAVLVVDLKTDYLAGVEIDGARLEVTSSSGELRTLPDVTIAEGATLLTGLRIGEISVPPGDHRLVLTLQRGNAPVATRAVSVTVTVDRAVTVLATRSCEDVRCEAPDSECVGGVCVSERCTPETPESCPAPACVADADCVPALSC
ncbi:MAG: hypothetical protein H6719_35790, partial [Sandaracinaceae bacterium]|nr:hypothetical protein [Sandaracinaceae bacterium]